MELPLPNWSSDLSTHYLDSCIEVFTNELNNAERKRSPAVTAVYAYLRGCARLARGEYLEGLRDLYSIENSNLFPQKYIETVIVPRLVDECLLDLFLHEKFYIECPEWKKVRIRPTSQFMPMIDLDVTKPLVEAYPVESPDVIDTEYDFITNNVTYQQFSDHVHRLSIVLDKETSETLFKALLYWADNSTTNTLKQDNTLTNSMNKPSEPSKSAAKFGTTSTIFTFEDTMRLVNDRRGNQSAALTPKLPVQSEPFLPAVLFEAFLDAWQQTNIEKVRMNRHLPEDRQKQESTLKVKLSNIPITL